MMPYPAANTTSRMPTKKWIQEHCKRSGPRLSTQTNNSGPSPMPARPTTHKPGILEQNGSPNRGTIIRDRFNFVSRFEDPALAPGVDDAVQIGRLRKKSQRHFENNRIDVSAGLRVLPAVNKAVIAVVVLELFIPAPRQRAWLSFDLA